MEKKQKDKQRDEEKVEEDKCGLGDQKMLFSLLVIVFIGKVILSVNVMW